MKHWYTYDDMNKLKYPNKTFKTRTFANMPNRPRCLDNVILTCIIRTYT